jgi:hypothetical protein
MFYTYIHLRKSDLKPFYVGKGSGCRAWSKVRSDWWKRIYEKHGYIVQICAAWKSEREAFEHEIFLISCISDMGIRLCNLTNGGEGASGARHSQESKRLRSISSKKYSSKEDVISARRKKMAETNKMPFNSERGAEAIRRNIHSRPDVVEKIKKCGMANIEKINSDPSLTAKRKEKLAEYHRSEKAKEISKAHFKKLHSNKEWRDEMTRKLIELRSIAVRCVDNGMEFKSASDAARWLSEIRGKDASSTHITGVCRGRLTRAYGLVWEYLK